MEFGSYHAIVACVAAGAGIAIVPRSVIRVSLAASGVATHALPAAVSTARTFFVWRRGLQVDRARRDAGRAAGPDEPLPGVVARLERPGIDTPATLRYTPPTPERPRNPWTS